MAEAHPFTIESFYKYVSEGKLMAAKCSHCGALQLPPRPMCTKCFSTDFEWVESAKMGKLLTYTVIHVSPVQFQSMVPYAVGIVRLQNGLNLPGMIHDVKPEEIKVGMELKVGIDKTLPSEWPVWPRYFFRPP